MKKTLILLLLTAVTIGTFANDSKPQLRIDVFSKNTMLLEPINGENLIEASHITWGAQENRDKNITSKTPITKEWSNYQMSFKAAGSGKITLSFKSANKLWIDITDVKVNGQLLPNGDFNSAKENKAGVMTPSGYWIGEAVTYSKNGGVNGSSAVTVCHDYCIGRAFDVVAGKTYTVEAKAKFAGN